VAYPGHDAAERGARDGPLYDVPCAAPVCCDAAVAEPGSVTASVVSLRPVRKTWRAGRAYVSPQSFPMPRRTPKWVIRGLRAEADADLAAAGDVFRPTTRGDCGEVERPCPFVSCKHNLYLDVSPRTGSVKLNFPDLEPGDMAPDRSCALDCADRGGLTLEEVGQAMNMTRERVRQLEASAVYKVGPDMARLAGRESESRRRLPIVESQKGAR
jgi:sigma-70-like protein